MSKPIANAHSHADCWNPHYHADGFKEKSASIFKKWYIKRYHGSVFHDLNRFAIAPLCVFGGGTGSEYTREASSMGGTYAVCPKCRRVIMCGYLDDKGLNPRKCGCGAKLEFNDYFQPVKLYKPDGKKAVDPAKDPAVTIAEICAYLPDGVPPYVLAAWIAILASKGLLKTGGFLDYGRFEVRHWCMESEQLHEAIRRGRWIRISAIAPRWNVKLGDHGRAMLVARGIERDARAKKELDRLQAVIEDHVRLKAEAVAALATMLNR